MVPPARSRVQSITSLRRVARNSPAFHEEAGSATDASTQSAPTPQVRRAPRNSPAEDFRTVPPTRSRAHPTSSHLESSLAFRARPPPPRPSYSRGLLGGGPPRFGLRLQRMSPCLRLPPAPGRPRTLSSRELERAAAGLSRRPAPAPPSVPRLRSKEATFLVSWGRLLPPAIGRPRTSVSRELESAAAGLSRRSTAAPPSLPRLRSNETLLLVKQGKLLDRDCDGAGMPLGPQRPPGRPRALSPREIECAAAGPSRRSAPAPPSLPRSRSTGACLNGWPPRCGPRLRGGLLDRDSDRASRGRSFDGPSGMSPPATRRGLERAAAGLSRRPA